VGTHRRALDRPKVEEGIFGSPRGKVLQRVKRLSVGRTQKKAGGRQYAGEKEQFQDESF